MLPARAREDSGESASGAATLFSLPQEFSDMLDALPDAVRESVPPELYTADPMELGEALELLSRPQAVASYLLSCLSTHLGGLVRTFLSLCGVLILRAVWNCLAGQVRASGTQKAVTMLCRVAVLGVVVREAVTVLGTVTEFFESLRALTAASLPLMGAMYALGGNIGTALANRSGLILSMGVTSVLGGGTVVPLFSLCLALTLLGVFDGGVAGRMQLLASKLKKGYTTVLSFCMVVLSALLGAQTVLRARADNLTFRAVRFVVSSGIPVVGGGVAEMLRTGAAGVSYLRTTVGLCGVLLLFRLLLPTLLVLLAARWVWGIAQTVAAWLGCDEEGKLLGEVSSLHGYLLAVVSVSCLTFLFSLLLLMQCGAAGMA